MPSQKARKINEGQASSAGGAFFPRWIAGPLGLDAGGRRDQVRLVVAPSAAQEPRTEREPRTVNVERELY
jgi:hypothetical protein